MRNIVFRGKRIKDGEWIYGSLLINYFSTQYQKKVDAIVHSSDGGQKRDVIDYHTIGQMTGLFDRASTPIYQGDLVRFNSPYSPSFIGRVEWDIYNPCFLLQDINDHNRQEYDWVQCNTVTLEVIGNIWDNPELLKAEHNRQALM